MPIPLLVPAIIGISTVASLATPFFFPSEQDKATIELNKKLTEGNFSIVKNQPEIKVPDFSSKLSQVVDDFKEQITLPQNSIFIILTILAIIGLVLLR